MVSVNPLKDVRIIIGLVVTILITIALVVGGQTVMNWKEGYDQNHLKEGTLQSASGIIADGSKADADRSNVDQSIGQGRQQFQEDYDGAMTHEPETAARADRPVPDSVRRAFRERRLARERLGCAGEQCGERPADSSSAQR